MIMMYYPVEMWLERGFGHEEGYSNRSKQADPGGETKWGISKRSYPDLDIKNLSKSEAADIYRRDFIAPLIKKDLPPSIVYQLFDFAIHSGVITAVKQIQKTLNIPMTGVIDVHTAAKVYVTSESDLVMRITARRIRFLKSLDNWEANKDGWMERIATNLEYGAEDTD